MRFDDNGGASPNYEPNSFGGPAEDKRYVERPKQVSGTIRSGAGLAFSVSSKFPFLECREILLCQLQSAVVIAMIAVNVMQMTGNQVVHVIAVGNYLVSMVVQSSCTATD
jgi:hypothetical protein